MDILTFVGVIMVIIVAIVAASLFIGMATIMWMEIIRDFKDRRK